MKGALKYILLCVLVLVSLSLMFGCAPGAADEYDDLPSPPQLPPTGESSGDLVGEAYTYFEGYAPPYNVYLEATPDVARVLSVSPSSVALDFVSVGVSPSSANVDITVAGHPDSGYT